MIRHLFLSIAFSFLFAGCSRSLPAATSTPLDKETTPTAFVSKTPVAHEEGVTCEQEKEQILALIDLIEICQHDDECMLDRELPMTCPIGCYFLRNRSYDGSEDVSLLKVKLERFEAQCFSCVFDCPPPPEPDEIGCRENRCIDLRFYDE